MSKLRVNARVKYAAIAALSLSAIQLMPTGGFAADAAVTETALPNIAIAKFVLYGQLNYGLMSFDDGFDQEIAFGDNDNSSSRFGITGEIPLTSWLKAGANFETEIEANSSARVTLQNTNVGGVISVRKLEGWSEAKLASNVKLRVTVGQGSTASDSTSEQDLSGTKVIGYSNISPVGNSVRFRNSATAAVTGFRVGQVFNNLDGFSRTERLRADVKIGPVTFAGSITPSDDLWDVAAYFKHTIGDIVKIAAAISHGVSDPVIGTGFNQTSGSLSVLHVPTGISLTGAAGVLDSDLAGRNNRQFYYGKIAIIRSVFANLGDTAVGVDFFSTEDALANGDEGDSFGVFAVQNIDRYNTEFYALYRQFDYNRIGTPTENVQVFMTGARVKFKT
ncbi:MAG: hypothetical protein K8F25_01835 [Fimbriimonadaceae bacterium]|nr:hypothetical protein [Alphaproteobacteria bacterium]